MAEAQQFLVPNTTKRPSLKMWLKSAIFRNIAQKNQRRLFVEGSGCGDQGQTQWGRNACKSAPHRFISSRLGQSPDPGALIAGNCLFLIPFSITGSISHRLPPSDKWAMAAQKCSNWVSKCLAFLVQPGPLENGAVAAY